MQTHQDPTATTGTASAATPSHTPPSDQKRPLFALGNCCATPGALGALEKTCQSPMTFLTRHVTGDWSELPEEDQATNHASLGEGDQAGRIFSAYRLADGTKIYVITEWDRSVTTLLLPFEY
jgi:hypothetical protein